MWTPVDRAQLVREALPYATSLTDREWNVVAPILPRPAPYGRRPPWTARTLVDGMLYVLRTGCAWRHLPRDFPPWQTVYRWFARYAREGLFERLNHALTMQDCTASGINRLESVRSHLLGCDLNP